MRFVSLLAIFLLSGLLLSCGGDEATPSGAVARAPRAGEIDAKKKETGVQVECPVCGLQFDSSEALHMVEYKKNRYYFLLEDHKKALLADPGRYIGKD